MHPEREELRAKIARWMRSARGLPARVSHAARVGIQVVSWAATLQLRAGLERRRDARLIRRSGLFDRDFYLAQCPGDRDARRDPEEHYLRVGAARGFDPSPRFQGAAYLRRNPHAAGENPLVHVIRSRREAADRRGQAEASVADRFRSEPLLLGKPFPAAVPGDAVLVVAGRGSPRSDEGRVPALAQMLRDLGHGVTVVDPDAAPLHLAERGHAYVAVLLAGPADAARALGAVRAYAPRATLAYQAAGLPSMLAEARLAGDAAAVEEVGALARLEHVNVACADVVLVGTPRERDRVLARVPGQRVEVIPSVAAAADRGDEGRGAAMAPVARGRVELALGIGGGVAASQGRADAEAPPPRAASARDEKGARAAPARDSGADRSVLAVGVYLADRRNTAAEIARELARSERWTVEQRWVALGRSAPPAALAAITARRERSRVPKFVLLNRLLRDVDLDRHAFVLVCDDDIALPGGFVDAYLELVARYDLALAQPARTHDSDVDHPIVERLDGLAARATRFVEIGPLFSLRRDAARLLTPFDESSPMGWGYDFAWPVAMERAGLRMGIVDATPVAHNLRAPVSLYDDREAAAAMKAYLDARPHLSPDEAFSIVEAYPEP